MAITKAAKKSLRQNIRRKARNVKKRNALKNLIHVPFRLESIGSQISLYDPAEENYYAEEEDRDKWSLWTSRELNTM